MRKDHEEIPQIKPSLLDPPQIKLSEMEAERGAVEVERPKIPKFRFKKVGFGLKRRRKLFLGLALLLVLFLIAVILPGFLLVKDAIALQSSAKKVSASLSAQDISVVKDGLGELRGSLNNFKKSYSRFGWSKFLPVVGQYYKDGEAVIAAGTHALDAGSVVVETVEPYADIIGFGGGSVEGANSANDRIEFLIETIDDILPKADEITRKARLAKKELEVIKPDRYPEKIFGRDVRGPLKKYLLSAEEAVEFVANSKPLLEAAPYLLGVDGTRTYLLLFQNDKELRPTGGFITAYSIIEVTNGKIKPVSSNDIYNLDNRYTPRIEAPEVVREYLKGPYLISRNLRLRDMNWSPDFYESMKVFVPEAEKAGIPDVDGVIAVDTQVVVNILNAIGPVEVPGYGQYSTNNDERCNCPQVIYELESFADVEGPIVWSENEPGKIVFAPPNYLNRKEIVGPLMNSVLASALGQPKEKLPDLIAAGWRSLTEKHVLMYMFEQKAQDGAEAFGAAGRVRDFEGDYLKIVDANLGGRKSNLYVTQEVSQEIEVDKDGSITKTVSITYQNSQDYDGWLNSVLPNWTRVYIPAGSEVVDVEGFDVQGEVYEELGKTVVSGGFELRPKGIKKISLTFKLPFKKSGEYRMLVQKQAGLDAPLYSIKVGKNLEELYLRTDREFIFEI